MSYQKPFYEKFIKKPAVSIPQEARNSRTKTQLVKNDHTQPKQHHNKQDSKYDAHKHDQAFRNGSHPQFRYTALATDTPVFSALTPETKKILAEFPTILAQVLPLDAKKKQLLPQHIHDLFHELTDERGTRKAQYLNNPIKLSAYTHYYVWWNLVRLTKLLQNLNIQLDNDDYAADFGSGPLTLICALWIAKPELRSKQLTWYCVDISNKALSFGEDLFLALCAYTGKTAQTEEHPWRIKKVCGAFGTDLAEKVSLITEANMFNEIFWNSPLSLDEQAEKMQRILMRCLQPKASVLLIEPGIPLAGEFLSLVREQLLENGFSVEMPCPHHQTCCFPHRPTSGISSKIPIAHHKWCHFTFETTDSPKSLLKLSEAAKLGKERASLSFLFCTIGTQQDIPVANSASKTAKTEQKQGFQHKSRAKGTAPLSFNKENTNRNIQPQHAIPVRICSDIIEPEPKIIGRYACSERGFMLITTPAYRESILNTAVSGSLVMLPADSIQPHQRDKKTQALLVRLG